MNQLMEEKGHREVEVAKTGRKGERAGQKKAEIEQKGKECVVPQEGVERIDPITSGVSFTHSFISVVSFLSLSSWNLFVLGSKWRKKVAERKTRNKNLRETLLRLLGSSGKLQTHTGGLLEQLVPHEHTFDTLVYLSSKPG